MIVSYNSTCNLTLNMTNLNINHGLNIQLNFYGFPLSIGPFVLQDMSIYQVSFFVSSIGLADITVTVSNFTNNSLPISMRYLDHCNNYFLII